MITPFCFTVFLTEEALKKHNMYPFVLQRAVGMEKVDSWLLTAKHYENKNSSYSVHSIGPGKLCCMMQLLKDWKVSMGIDKIFIISCISSASHRMPLS